MTPFTLKIVTPNGVFFPRGDKPLQVLNVIVRTTVGDKGILARHEPYVAALPIGKMRVMDINGKYRTAAVSPGTIRVEENGDTVILVQSCEWKHKIDVERANAAKLKAEKRMANPNNSPVEKEIAEFKLKRALNRLEVAEEE